MYPPRQSILCAAAIVCLAITGPHAARAADWDGGDGVWSTLDAMWDGGNVWVQNSSAVFDGLAGTVTLGEDILVTTLTIDNTDYVIDLSGFDLTISSIGTSNGTVTNTSGGPAATLFVSSFPNSTPTLAGNLNVTWNGSSSWVPTGNNSFTGTLSLLGSAQVRPQNNSVLGSDVGQIILGGNTNLAFEFGTVGNIQTATRDIELVGTGQRINANSVRGIMLTGSISGTGELHVSQTQGMVILAGDNSYSGITRLSGQGPALIVAHDNALGNSPEVIVSAASTFGFMGGVDVSATPLRINGSAPASGWGSVQSLSGHNTFAGVITSTNNTIKQYGVLEDSLTLTGVISHQRGINKLGDGMLVLAGANTYGSGNVSDTSNGTIINAGTLRLDFSLASVTQDIINQGRDVGSNTSSHLGLSGGTLEIVGKPDETILQRFTNRNHASGAFTINPGASTVEIIQNGAESITLQTGRLPEANRKVGGTVNFILPELEVGQTAAIFLSGSTGGIGVTNTILTANGAAFATVDGTDWAALDGSRNIIGGSNIGGFYTANDASTLSGNADMSGGVDTTLAADATVTSLRFNDAAARSIDVGGNTLTTGGILVTAAVGNHVSTITGGTLQAAAGTANQDLVVFQNNIAGHLVIGASIADNEAATGLTKSGLGTLELAAANTYTGVTTVNEGVLKLAHADALGGGNLQFKGGVIGLTEESSDFIRSLGTGAGAVRFLDGGGGFAAYGGERIVNIGGSGGQVVWHSSNFLPTQSALILGAADADGTVVFENAIRLHASSGNAVVHSRVFQVENGLADVDARMTGIISHDAGITKDGAGTLELAADNTYTGATHVNAGRLLVSGSLHSASAVTVNTSAILGGNGSIGGSVAVLAGGTLSPGTSVGTLNVGSLNLNPGSFAFFEIDGDGLSSDFDRVIASGAVNFGGTLQVSFSGNFGEDSWDLFDFTGSTGDFSSIVDVSGFYSGYILSFDSSTGVLTAVIPEPGTLALAAMGGVLLFVRRRSTR